MDRYIIALREMRGITQNFIHTPHFKKTFAYGIALHLIALFALLRGDIYYMDDFQHSISDNSNAKVFGRYVMAFVLNYIAPLGKGMVDMSPLPQILGVILVVASSLILVYLIRGKFDLLGIVASLPLGLSPHFLQNLSYKFDSLTMGIALFLAVLPFLFKENKCVFCYVSVVCLLLMLMSYQAANAAYIILSVFFAFSAHFLDGRNLKQSTGFLALCACNLIIASLIYKLAIAEPVSEYIVAYTSDKMLPLDSRFLLGVWGNLATYLTTIFDDLKQTPYIWLILLNFVLFVVNTAFYSNRPKIATIPSVIIFLVFGIALSYGLYLVLEKPLFEPRVFYGFNAIIATICIANVSLLNRTNSHTLHKIAHYTSATIAIITAYFLISFANIYGNALKKQDEYLDFRAKALLNDLSNMIPRNSMVDLRIYVDYSAVTRRFIDRYGAITRIIPKVADNDWWFYLRLRHLNAPYNFNDSEMCEFLQERFGTTAIATNTYHTIEKAKSCYIVTLKK